LSRADPEQHRENSGPQDLASGRDNNGRIGRFRLLRVLGTGSTGTIHAAQDLETGETAAIKLARLGSGGDDWSSIGAIEREAEVLSMLHHPNVVRLKQSGMNGGTGYLVLEHLQGMDLETSLLTAGRLLDETELRALLLPLTDALAHIHGAGVLHRDLKPGNIGLRNSGEPVIVDFGAAERRAGPPWRASRWSDVTAGYAAPEQYLEGGSEGPWTDVYGLGAIAYRAIAGAAPPAAPARLAGEAMAPAAAAGEGRYSAGFLRAIDWALELAPEARPQTAATWAQALNASIGETAMPDEQQHSGAEGGMPDPYPPTVRIERSSGAAATPAGHAPAATARAAESAKAQPRSWVWMVLIALVAGVASAGWFGWPLYQRYFKTTWIVDASGGGDTLTIAEAILRAADYATVLVRPGTYAESLELDRPVYLKAAETGAQAPLLAPTEGPCIVVTAAAGAIVGLRLRGVAPAESVPSAAEPCLDIAGSGVLVEANEIAGSSGPGIRVRDGAAPTIRSNTITEAGGTGVLVSAGARGAILDNRIDGAGGAGMVVRGGSTPEIVGNLIADSGAAGVLFTEAASGRFDKNVIRSSTASGIEVRASADPLVTRNRIESAGQAGIFVYDLGKGRFRNNEVVSSGYSGLVIAAGGAPDFVTNVVRGSAEHGILAIDRSGGVIDHNTVLDNTGHGIALAKDTDIDLGENTLEDNKEPQVLDGWVAGF
jgi:parallel beta-helix repeat protein